MALVSSLITNAFYLAKVGGLSKQGGQTPSVTQETDALSLLNNILDSLSLDNAFNAFLYEVVIPSPSTRDVYIGRNLTPVSGVTIIDDDPFKLIFAASVSIPINPYPLIIRDLTDLHKTPFALIDGQPGYIFWSIQEQDNNIFSRLVIYPTPNQSGDITVVGIKVLPSDLTTDKTLLPTFFSYLKYRVAEELSAQYGTMDIWNSTGLGRIMNTYRKTLADNVPINGTPNDLSSLLNRRYYGNYPWY